MQDDLERRQSPAWRVMRRVVVGVTGTLPITLRARIRRHERLWAWCSSMQVSAGPFVPLRAVRAAR
jgi:hypothetical protein